jgi:hypothetical protein
VRWVKDERENRIKSRNYRENGSNYPIRATCIKPLLCLDLILKLSVLLGMLQKDSILEGYWKPCISRFLTEIRICRERG